MGNATRRTRVQAEAAQLTGPKAERQQGRRAETPDDRRDRLQRIRGKSPAPRVTVLKPDAVLDPGPLGWLSPGFAGGNLWTISTAGAKPPLDDQRGRR